MESRIHTSDLRREAVPSSPAEVEAFGTFARSFDGYAHWGDRCASLAEAAAESFHADGTLPEDLDDLRACLFFEQQRWHWRGEAPDAESTAYLQALLDAIRAAAPG